MNISKEGLIELLTRLEQNHVQLYNDLPTLAIRNGRVVPLDQPRRLAEVLNVGEHSCRSAYAEGE